jgi:hypothetical protein
MVLGLSALNRQTKQQENEVLTQTKIAICVATAVGTAVLPTTHAFAGNAYDSPD